MLAELSPTGDLVYARRKSGSILTVLDAQGRAQSDASSRGPSARDVAEREQHQQEREREMPRHLGENAPK